MIIDAVNLSISFSVILVISEIKASLLKPSPLIKALPTVVIALRTLLISPLFLAFTLTLLLSTSLSKLYVPFSV